MNMLRKNSEWVIHKQRKGHKKKKQKCLHHFNRGHSIYTLFLTQCGSGMSPFMHLCPCSSALSLFFHKVTGFEEDL